MVSVEPFDLVFVDLEFSAYRAIVEQILDRGLLANNSTMLVDNDMPAVLKSSPRPHGDVGRIRCPGFCGRGVPPTSMQSSSTIRITQRKVVLDFNAFVAAVPA